LNSQATQERITNHHDGILAANIEDFEKQIIELCADKSKRVFLGKNATQTAKSQKWDDIFNRLYQEYCEVIESTKTNFPNKAA
jgi:hypothetical protein